MTILIGLPGRDALLEPIENVLPQSGLVIVDEDRRGDMHRRDEDKAFANARRGTTGLDVVGDVDDLLPILRGEGEIRGVRLHVA
jgi:hypothetical protein